MEKLIRIKNDIISDNKSNIELLDEEYIDKITDRITDEFCNFEIISIFDVLKKIGFSIFLVDRLENSKGLVGIDGKLRESHFSDKCVGLLKYLSLEEKEFLLVKTFGYYLFNDSDEFYMDLSKNNKENKNMDYFARSLLMPSDKFISFYKDCSEWFFNDKEIVLNISSKMGIPINQVNSRIMELNLVEFKGKSMKKNK